MNTTTSRYVASLPLILDTVEVRAVERVSPSYVRVELGGACLAEFGLDGPVFDQRIKLIFPNAQGGLPDFSAADDSWWSTWMEIPEHERGSMRTYTLRDVLGDGVDTRFVVDIVVHEGDEGAGNAWAQRAAVGDRVMIMAPRRGHEYGGIEWSPASANRVLIVGDETAVPAIRGILRDLAPGLTGAAFLEVPESDDIQQDVVAPAGIDVIWLPRDGARRGVAVHAAALSYLTAEPAHVPEVSDDDIDPDLWETPVYSSSGAEVRAATDVPVSGTPYPGLYAWIAGESKVVTGLRRALVNDLGLDRGQVAFMGYWREGVAMRS